MINIIYTVISIACLMAGFYFGFRIGKQNEIPTIPQIKTPAKIIKEHKAIKEAEKEISKLNTILTNLDNYDGTEMHQEEVEK